MTEAVSPIDKLLDFTTPIRLTVRHHSPTYDPVLRLARPTAGRIGAALCGNRRRNPRGRSQSWMAPFVRAR
jgi:hypothetical protein